MLACIAQLVRVNDVQITPGIEGEVARIYTLWQESIEIKQFHIESVKQRCAMSERHQKQLTKYCKIAYIL